MTSTYCTTTTTTTTSTGDKQFTPHTTEYAIYPPQIPSVAIANNATTRFPVHRIYCVGRNYATHVQEMGGNPKNDPPTFFTKPADAVVDSLTVIPYPSNTSNLHYEVELVVALGEFSADDPPPTRTATTTTIPPIFGYAVGIDLTRRDLQSMAKQSGSPWDCSKAFDRSAPVGPITPCRHDDDDDDNSTIIENKRMELTVNGIVKQSTIVPKEMIWSIPEILQHLARNFELQPGDLIFTGTPSGVGPLQVGDRVCGRIEGLEPIEIEIKD